MVLNFNEEVKKNLLTALLNEMLFCLDLNQIKNLYKAIDNNPIFSEEEKIAIYQLGYTLKKSIICKTEEKNERVYDIIKKGSIIDSDGVYTLINYIVNDIKRYNEKYQKGRWTLNFDRIFNHIEKDNDVIKLYTGFTGYER